MKHFLFLLALIPSFVFAQEFQIFGKVDGIGNGEAKVSSTMDKTVVAIGSIKEGMISVRGSVPEPGLYWITLGNEQAQHIFLENKSIRITGSKADIKNLKIEGSDSHKDFEQFRSTFNPLFGELNALGAQLQKTENPHKREKLRMEYDSVSQKTNNAIEAFIRAKNNSFVSPFLLFVTADLNDDIMLVEQRYQLLDESIRASKIGKSLNEFIAFKKFGAVGTPAVDFTQNDPAGNPVTLASFKGKYVLVDFWASWCRPCRMENPFLVKAYNKFKNKNFTVLGISLDQEKEAWLKAIEKDKLTWTHVSDLQFWNNSVAQLYRINSIPQNFLIGPDGTIVAKNLSGEALEEKLCSILGCN